MLRRASRAGLFLAKSRLRNLCENLLGEDHSLTRSLFPPPVDRIKQQAQVRAQLHTSLKNLAAAARNHSATHSLEKGPGPSGDVSEWTLEHVKSGELTTTQLMQLARLRFTGSTHSHTHSPTPSDTPSDTTPAHSHTHSRDPELAVAAWVQASKQGDTHAAYSVAFCLLNGIGIARDEQEAFALMHPLAHSYDNAYAHVSE
jgi:TPR repeat protein